MESESEKIEKELNILGEAIHECIKINWSGKGEGYLKMSFTELDNLYNKVENGLISFNLIGKDISKIVKEEGEELVNGGDGFGRFLESQLLSIVASAVTKNPHHEVSQRLKDFSLSLKIKNKRYYNQLFELTGLGENSRDSLYCFLQS